MNKHLSSLAAIAVLALSGCQGSGGSSSSSSSSTPGPSVAAGQMADYCRAQASQQLGPSLEQLSTDDPVTTASGTTVRGTWDSTVTGNTAGTFQCNFGPNGQFQSVRQI